MRLISAGSLVRAQSGPMDFQSRFATFDFHKTCTVSKLGEARRHRIGFTFPNNLRRNFRGMDKGMKSKSKISGHIIRGGAWAVFLSAVFIALSSASNSPNMRQRPAGTTSRPRTFSFAERVAYQRATEDVYWRHRIWPKENPNPKPSLDAVMSQAELEKKVEEYLLNSKAVEDYWQRPITAEQLQAEMDRMAKHTNQPEMLHELF